mgnify:FL=1
MRNQYLSRTDVKEYLSQFSDVTVKEKSELLKWLKTGNDYRDNAYFYADESGKPMDFVTAMRFDKELSDMRTANPELFLPYVSTFAAEYGDLPF